MNDDDPLGRLREAKRVGWVFSGGSARCAFQVGVIETLRELGVRPAMTIGVSAGVWNAAAVAAGTDSRLRYYWKSFVRMPHIDVRNVLRRDHSPFLFSELHHRTFSEYVGAERLRAPQALPCWIGVTRLRDRKAELILASSVDDPLNLLLAANYLPPWYTRSPRINGAKYGDGGVTDNMPYEKAFDEGCDGVVIVTLKGESEGGLYRSVDDINHEIPDAFRDRVVVIRPRHRVPVGFTERRWSVLSRLADMGRLRAREVLLGERHPETDWSARGKSPTARLLGPLRKRRSAHAERGDS